MKTEKYSIITYEGSEKYTGDKVFLVEWKPFLISHVHCITVVENIYKLYDRHIFFSKHENAMDYILLNKPCLNVKEISEELGWFFEKEKTKVNFKEMIDLLKSLVFGKIPVNRKEEQRQENRTNIEKLRTSPERRYMIDFVKWITENYEFKDIVIPYEVVDKWEESKT